MANSPAYGLSNYALTVQSTTDNLLVYSNTATGSTEFSVDGTGNVVIMGNVWSTGTSSSYFAGSVGIGTSSPTTKLTVQTAALTDAIRWTDNINSTGILSTAAGLSTMWTTTALGFGTGSGAYTERMRIDSSGNWYLGTTTNLGKMTTGWNNSTQTGFALYASTTTFSGSPIVFFNSSGGISGSIGQTASTVSYNTSSDYRLKENVLPLTSGLTTISALKPVKYDWKIDGSHGEGFIAHELQSVIPHAVTGEKDAVNEDGTIKSQGVDYSKIVVHLVAAIRELKAEFDAYKESHP